MQEYTKFTASKSEGVQIQKKTYRAYGSFIAGLIGILCSIGGFIFDVANMIDWIVYGCSMVNILLHILIGLTLIAALVGSAFLMRSGGKKYLYRAAEVLRIYNDHLYIQYIPYRSSKHVHINIYYCDIREMEYLPSKFCVCINSPAMIRTISDKNGVKKVDASEPDKGIYYIYGWYPDYTRLLDLIEEKSLRKIQGRTA